MTLKYPQQLNEGQVDYMTFRHMEYRTNRNIRGGNERFNDAGERIGRMQSFDELGGAPPAAGGSQDIILYMPTTTPGTNAPQGWGEKSFDGPLGLIQADVGSALANTAMGLDASSVATREATDAKITEIVDRFKPQIEGLKTNATGAIQQSVVKMAAGIAGTTPNQLLAMSRGEIFNPNTELLYDGPQVRSFSFNFSFVPKSESEARVVTNIIKEFKVWSSPEETGNGMYKVPHVWQLEYCTGSGQNRNMNLFKPMACTTVGVQANPGMPMHMSFPDGMPVVYTMSLSFIEVDVITRNNQQEAANNVGF